MEKWRGAGGTENASPTPSSLVDNKVVNNIPISRPRALLRKKSSSLRAALTNGPIRKCCWAAN